MTHRVDWLAWIAVALILATLGILGGIEHHTTCYEDQSCWNCQTMGNGRCGQ